MKWLIIIFILGWLWCSACEKNYDAARNKVEETSKKLYNENKDTIKKGARTALSFVSFIGFITNRSNILKK